MSVDEHAHLSNTASKLAKERADLAKAEQDIVDGERRISEQMLRLERLHAEDKETDQGEMLLKTLEATLVQWRMHREEILHRIDYLLSDPKNRRSS
jgi:hypothetical protein